MKCNLSTCIPFYWLGTALMLIFTLSSCSSIKVLSSDFNEQSLENYETFNFYDVKVNALQPELVKANRVDMLKNAVTNELVKTGLTQAENPDLWVNIGVLVENKQQTRQTNIREAPVYIGQRNYHWESEEIVVAVYQEGTVTIDLIDAESNKMVAQAIGTGVIVEKDKKLQKRIDQGMNKIFEELLETKEYL